MTENPFKEAMKNSSNSQENPKVNKKVELGKTIEIALPEEKVLKSKSKESLTINYLTPQLKKSFKDLAKQMNTTQTKLFEYLINKEWTKYKGK